MMGKQYIIDIAVTLLIPLLFIGGYYTFFKNDIPPVDVLALPAADEPGAKTESALVMLKSIHLNDGLFTDPAFLMLVSYEFPIPTVPLSRRYPFTPPEEIVKLKKSAVSQVATPISTPTPTTVKKK